MSNFPNQIDTDVELPSSVDGSTEINSEILNSQKDAILAVEHALGVDINGSMSTLSERLDVSLNQDGTIKSTALEAAGLVSLPITDSHVSSNAAIKESKLDLDFSTSALNDDIASNDIDIYNLQVSQTSTIATLASHIDGSANKHSASAITNTSILGQTNVQAAMSALELEIEGHINSNEAHQAEHVAYQYSDELVSVDNVSSALDILFDGSAEGIRSHFNLAHESGIVINNDTGGVLCMTKITPLGGNDIIKIANPRNPTIRSSGFNPFGLNASAANIDISYFDGYQEKEINITGLNLSSYITSDNRLEGVISNINIAFCSARAPLFAFADRGEIAIQHGLPDGYFSISQPSNSAIETMGLSSFVSESIAANNDSSFVVHGAVQQLLAENLYEEITLNSSSATLPITTSLTIGSLVYITNHISAGVYQIISTGPTSITLNATIQAGTMLVRSYSDSVKIEGLQKQTFDVLVDASGLISKTKKIFVTTSQISNIVIVDSNLPAGNYSLLLTGSASYRYLRLFDGTSYGKTIAFTNGWTGYLQIPSVNEKYEIIVEVVSQNITYPATDQFSSEYTELLPANMKIGSFWTNGASTQLPFDTRKLNLQTNQYNINRLSFVKTGLQITQDSNELKISSGTVEIFGREIQIGAATFDFSLESDNFIIWIDQIGSYRVSSHGTGDVSSEIFSKEGLLIAYIASNLGISSFEDWRVFNKDKSLFSISSTQPATCMTLSGGITLANLVNQKTIHVLSDEVATNQISISGYIYAEGRSLTFANVICNSANIICSELITNDISITNSKFIIDSISSNNLNVADSSIYTDELLILTGLTISGAGTFLTGLTQKCSLQMGSAFSIKLDGCSDCILQNLSIDFIQSTNAIFETLSNCESVMFDDIIITPNVAISLSNANSSTLCAFLKATTYSVSDLKMSNLVISDRSSLLINTNNIDNLYIDTCSLQNSGGLIRNTGTISNLIVKNIIGGNQTSTFLSLAGTVSSVNIDNIEINSIFALSTNLKLLSANSISNINIKNVYISDITTSESLISTASDLKMANLSLENISISVLFDILSGFVYANSVHGIDITGNLVSGSGLELINSKISFITSSNPINVGGAASTDFKVKIKNSILSFPSSSVFSVSQYDISDSNISCGRFIFAADATDMGSRLVNTSFDATNTAASISFDFSGLTDGPDSAYPFTSQNISKCIFNGSPTSDLIRVLPIFASKSLFKFEQNNCRFEAPSSGNSIIRIGSAATTNTYVLSDNTLSCGVGTLDKVFHIIDSNITIKANTILATNVSSYIFGTSASTAQKNIRIFENNIVGTITAAPTNFAGVLTGYDGTGNFQLFDNFGIEETLTISLFGYTVVEGSWGLNTNNLITNTLTDSGLIKELNLPIGRLKSASLRVYAAGAIGTLDAFIYSQPNTMSAPYLVASGTNTLSSGEQTINFLINDVTYYINNNERLYLYIDTSANNNILSNLVVKVIK